MKHRILAAALAVAATVVGLPSAVPAVASAPAPMVTITVKVDGCQNRCKLTLVQHVAGATAVWRSRTKTVVDGRARFVVPRARTRGMHITIVAPWERNLDYVTVASFRYLGETPGSSVTLAEARRKPRASACWAGTNAAAHTIPLRVRPLTVKGPHSAEVRTVAWVNPQARTWAPMMSAPRGILGTQDVISCRRA